MTTYRATNEYDSFSRINPSETFAQIGKMNVLAISGGRRSPLCNSNGEIVGIRLPVHAGYRVDVLLAGNDTYTVRRVFARAGKEWVKGEQAGVYCDTLGETAYVASCHVNRSFGNN